MTAATIGSLRIRDRQPEVMDQSDLDQELHRDALRGLGRINQISQTARQFWPELERLARLSQGRPLRVLDAACGGGDVAIALSLTADRRQLPIELRGCDLSATALEYAREQAWRRGARVSFFEHDILEHGLPDCDAMVCSLFLHHLTDLQATSFLAGASKAVKFSLQISDLVRSRLGYAFALIGCRLLTRSEVVHIDGPRSVAAAFTIPESRALAEQAGLEGVAIQRKFPERFLLVWRRS